MKAAGIIFANLQNEMLDELTRKRTTASLPFGGRYRLIDFALSNIVSADIVDVGVIAQKNYQSLMDHVGSGKDWDLSRRNGGLRVFPPFGNYKSDFLFTNRLEALKTITGFISKVKDEVMVLMDCDSVNVIDFDDLLKKHHESKADITVVYQNCQVPEVLNKHMSIELDENGRVIKGALTSEIGTTSNVSINVWVMSRRLLLSAVDEAISLGLNSFEKDIILNNISSLRVYGYEYKGIYLPITSMEDYYKNNMKLLEPSVREAIFEQENHRIYTKVRDSAPTKFGKESKVVNSFIADGCEIEGTVINSILFRGVKVGKGTVIKDSILMQDTIIGDNVNLECVITDKNVAVRDRNHLAGCKKIPYYLSKNAMV